jgi:hypothetical protein
MREKDGMVYVDVEFLIREEYWESLKKMFDRLSLGINDVLKQVIDREEFIKYIKDNSRKYRFRRDLTEKELRIWIDKGVYEKIKKLAQDLKLTQKLIVSMAITYYFESQKPKKAQVDITLEIKRPKKPQIVF